MADLNYDRLVELITKEVLKTVSGKKETGDSAMDFRPMALVLGACDKLPLFAENYMLVGIDDYAEHGDIERYDRIYITELSTAELADIAFGKDTRPLQCAVIKALLCGKPVYLMESAIAHRKYKESANRNYFNMLEGYVYTLQSFGVELIREQNFGKNLSRSAIADNSVDKVITETIAKGLVKKPEEVIYLRKGTVLTPSAKDIFNHSQKTVEFVD